MSGRASIDHSCVTLRFEPGLANYFRFRSAGVVRWFRIVALFYEGGVAVLHGVVVGGLCEIDLARFPESFFTFLLLTWKELSHEGVMTLGHILVPAFFDLGTNSINQFYKFIKSSKLNC